MEVVLQVLTEFRRHPPAIDHEVEFRGPDAALDVALDQAAQLVVTKLPGLAGTGKVRPASAPIDVLSKPVRSGRDLSGVGQIGEELEEMARLRAELVRPTLELELAHDLVVVPKGGDVPANLV